MMVTTPVPAAQPDVTLHLDASGLIENATLSQALPEPDLSVWLGRAWEDTTGTGGGDQVRGIIQDARASGVSGFREILQRFPSGLELPIEYMTVRLGGKGGFVAVGKTRQAVAELESRLAETQRAMERDSWKLREIETRYRHLFNTSYEAVLLIKGDDGFRIIEANPEAVRILGLAQAPETVVGQDLLQLLGARERDPVQDLFFRVQAQVRAPGMLVHLGRERRPWMVRASLLVSKPDPVFLVQLSGLASLRTSRGRNGAAEIPDLMERLPDGFVVVDFDGVIQRANLSFSTLVQLAADESVLGEHAGRWIRPPGADLDQLFVDIRRNGVVKGFAATVHGDLGAATEVDISAVADAGDKPRLVAALLRDMTGHARPNSALPHADNGYLISRLGKEPLHALVDGAVADVEFRCIKEALQMADGNRSAAANILGLSRQSLYAKLSRYGLSEKAAMSGAG